MKDLVKLVTVATVALQMVLVRSRRRLHQATPEAFASPANSLQAS
jgi:hypothetical protein